MSLTPMLLSVPTFPLKCLSCGRIHISDCNGDWGCLVLFAQRLIPASACAWCNETCFVKWFESPKTKRIFK